MGENTRYLLKEWNFIQVSVSSHFSYNFSEKLKHVCVNIHDLFWPKECLDFLKASGVLLILQVITEKKIPLYSVLNWFLVSFVFRSIVLACLKWSLY